MPDESGRYTPPEAGEAPEEVRHILDKVYNKCRKEHPGEHSEYKERCAKIAWAAVKQAGYEKGEGGKWVKKAGDPSPTYKDTREVQLAEYPQTRTAPLEVMKAWEMDIDSLLASPRKVRGTFHKPVVDRDRELILKDAISKAVPDFMQLPVLHDFHKERPVGLATSIFELSDGSYEFEGVIKSTTDTDDVWNLIQKGDYGHLSIFGKRTDYSDTCKIPPGQRTSPCVTSGIRLDSISVCDGNARNPHTSLEIAKAGPRKVFDVTQILKAETAAESPLMHVVTDYAEKEDLKKMGGEGKLTPDGRSEPMPEPDDGAGATRDKTPTEPPMTTRIPDAKTTMEKPAEVAAKADGGLESKIDQMMAILQKLVASDKAVHESMGKAGASCMEEESKATVVAQSGEKTVEVKKAETTPEPQATPAPNVEDVVKARTDEIRKAYDAKVAELQSRIETLEKAIVPKKEVVVIPEQLTQNDVMSNAKALAAFKKGA